MHYEPQHFTAPDGTAMVVLTAADYAELSVLAEHGRDIADASTALRGIESGDGTMPAEVLAFILDDNLTPLAAWRRYRQFSQAELARRAGLHQTWIGRIEGGGGYGTPATRRKLAGALDAPLWTLEDPA